ncbi:hypothetical protein PDENDC454_20817 [Paenibacillus dendritiformis C454]|uniref:Uncharacterized protein n=1 Tax=Paenibacillus dendritiformis C454 TaxID=1131935 RepID=H3SKS9_9BACL|nr:hypothetical protein PDENDC454_20817 [Paenibacillus dendritiformis C454]
MRTYRPLFFRGSHIEDLIKEGLSGDELLTKFRERQAELHIAIENGIADPGKPLEIVELTMTKRRTYLARLAAIRQLPDDRRSDSIP